MNRNTAAGRTAMFQNGVCQRTDLPQGKSGALREKTDAAFLDTAAQAKGDAQATDIGPYPDSDGLRLGYADDMIATVVIGSIGKCRVPDRVPEDLDHGFRGCVVPRRTWAQAGSTTVDAEGGDTANMNDGDGKNAGHGRTKE
ncbi:MAG: hypothetical protein Q9187_007762 [Circinaria calcarea]